MPGAASGLVRDIQLIRRRAWIFIPCLLLGIAASLVLGRIAGQSNATATLQLETVVQDLVAGGDRGLRIFEAEAMTSDTEFKAKVRERLGDKNFDYGRYTIALLPVSVADGVSRGALTVAIKDDSKANAERFRQAWVDVFAEEYTKPEGLFRQRFVSKKQVVADLAEKDFADAYQKLKPVASQKGLPLDELLRMRTGAGVNMLPGTLVARLNDEQGALIAQLAQVTAALASPASITATLAAAILGAPVADGAAEAALRARQAILTAAIAGLDARRLALSDIALDPAFVAELDNLRALAEMKQESYVRINNARVAVTSAQSTIDIAYDSSGGVSGTLLGRVAIVVAVTLVFGLIAIYLFEWLAQVRARA